VGNLRDQLKQANVLSKKDAKRLAHEERMRRKELGRAGLEAEESARRGALESQTAETRAADRERQAQLEASRKQREEAAACREILRTGVEQPDRRGTIRWFFETADGALPWLMLDHGTCAQLTSGATCIVRIGATGAHAYGLLGTELARRVHRQFPDRVAWSAPGALA
jgi:uncharacterized protein YaiL (DUF2058 family)